MLDQCDTIKRKDANERNERISREKLKNVRQKLKNGEAVGPDGIPYEF